MTSPDATAYSRLSRKALRLGCLRARCGSCDPGYGGSDATTFTKIGMPLNQTTVSQLAFIRFRGSPWRAAVAPARDPGVGLYAVLTLATGKAIGSLHARYRAIEFKGRGHAQPWGSLRPGDPDERDGLARK